MGGGLTFFPFYRHPPSKAWLHVSASTWRSWICGKLLITKLTGYQVSKCSENLIGKDLRLADLKATSQW